jgi:hypothetical protein
MAKRDFAVGHYENARQNLATQQNTSLYCVLWLTHGKIDLGRSSWQRTILLCLFDQRQKSSSHLQSFS